MRISAKTRRFLEISANLAIIVKNEVARYLSERGVLVDDIIDASLSDINVSATPTLFLVDRSGSVRDVWVGKLDELKETEVAQRILGSH